MMLWWDLQKKFWSYAIHCMQWGQGVGGRILQPSFQVGALKMRTMGFGLLHLKAYRQENTAMDHSGRQVPSTV